MPPSPCKQCGTLIPQGSRFCPQCGSSLGGSTPVAEPAGGPWEVILLRLREAALPRYQVRKLLGSGGMAGVYLADEPRLGRRVAIKVMSPGLMADPAQVDRFHQEARATARLSHPNIVTIHEIDDRGGLHYFVMAYVEGRTLGDVLSEAQGPLPVPVVLRWFRQITGALNHAHRLGIVHRDVKPGNILLDGDGNALVTDFGIAKVADEPGLTRTGMLVGTPTYMSPEQCLSTGITGAADQYSLGILVYHMLTGSPPFTGGTMAVLQAHVGQRPEPLLSRRPDCPPELAALVDRMMAKDPGDRWPSLSEVLEILEEPGTSTAISTGMLTGAPGRPRAPTMPPPADPPPAREGPPPSRTPAAAAPSAPPSPSSRKGRPEGAPQGPGKGGAPPAAGAPPRSQPPAAGSAPPDRDPRGRDPVAVPGGVPAPAPSAPARTSRAAPPPSSRQRPSSPLPLVGGGLAVAALAAVAFFLVRGGGETTPSEGGGTVAASPGVPPREDPRLQGMGGGVPPDESAPDPGEGLPEGDGGQPGEAGDAGPPVGEVSGATVPAEVTPPPATGPTPPRDVPPPATQPTPSPPAPARISVAGTLPPGARLTAAGPPGTLGLSPGGTELPPGRWTLEFQAPGHRSQREVITLESGARFTWAPELVQDVPVAPPVEEAPPEPAGFDEAAARQGVESALAAFAGAFQSRNMQNVIRSYPASNEEWRQEWRPLVEDTRNIQDLQAAIGGVRHLSTTEGAAEVAFVLSLRYVDLRNRPQAQELPFRGRLTPGGNGWTLAEVRSGG